MKRKISAFLSLTTALSSFSALGISTIAAKELPYAPEGYSAYYSFDDTPEENAKLSVIKPGSWTGTKPASGVDGSASAVYSSANSKYGKSLDLSAGDYGVMLEETIPQDSSYTVSFWGYVTDAATVNTAAVMLDANTYNDDNSVAEESWHRIVPYGGTTQYKNEYVFQYRENGGTQLVWSGIKNDAIAGAWHLYTVTYDTEAEASSIKLYLDGQEVTNSNKTALVPDLARDSEVYIGVNPWTTWDKTFKGYIDDLYIYESVLTADEVQQIYAGTTQTDAEGIAESLYIPETVYGNVNLPSELDGAEITWTSTDENVISVTQETLNTEISEKYDTYSVIPAGVVTRQAEDTAVTLTAEVTYGDETVTRGFDVTVKAAAKTTKEMAADGDFEAYAYFYFRGDANTREMQQVYGATSLDGLNWTNLNNADPILTSSMGTRGLRDHFIVRAPEGDKFYLLCTDLDAAGGAWSDYATKGSKYIMVWESEDLVNWSDQRMVKLSTDDMGCTWAPETIYDENTGEYVIYWSSHVIDPNDPAYGKKNVYWARTRDFRSFTEPQVYVGETKGSPDKESTSYIDSTMIEGKDGNFYRVTKYEDSSPTEVFLEVSDAPLGDFTEVESNLSENDFLGVEGPALFKFNDRDEWCLMLDGYNGPNTNVGFFPSTITDLAGGQFTKVTSGFSMPTGPKHGVVVPITMEEYNALTAAYPTDDFEEKYSDTANVSALYTFNELADGTTRTTVKDRSGNGNDGTLKGAASYTYDADKDSKVLYTNGSSGSYMEFPLPKDADGNVLEYYTVSMDIKNLTEGNYFNFYVGDGSSNSSGINYYGYKMASNILLSSKDSSTEIKTTLNGKGVQGEWAHVDFVVSGGVCTIYVNGTKAGTMAGYYMTTINASVGRLSFSAWSADAYANSYYENVVIYDNALSETGIKNLAAINDPDDNKNEVEIGLDITAEKGVDIQDGMIGLFFEDINYAADGGLYAEMVENRSFEEIMHNNNDKNSTQTYRDPGYAWSAVDGTMAYKTDKPLNENNTHYLEFTGNSFKNKAYEGMYIEAGEKYKVSFYAKSDSYTGAVNVSAVKDGETALSGTVTDSVTDEWTKYEAEITADRTMRKTDFIVSLAESGTVDFDMISVFPGDAVLGIFRSDLAEKLKDLNPGFLRFPGGCIIEGWDLDNRYQWKNSIGPVEERVQNWNRWATSARPYYLDYNQTLGLGFYEYFLLCEYLECRPVPVLNVGMSCEYQGSETVPVFESDGVTYTAEFYQYIQDALDLIEFANGDVTTTWGAKRAEMGHPDPFNLDMVGIGNEQWAKDGNQWYERYEAFEKEIHAVYPGMKLVGTSGPGVQDADYNAAWSWIREKTAENPNFVSVVDEHYYRTPDWFYENINFYDDYPRDVKVFAGEYASRRRNQANDPTSNTWEAALSEGAYLTMVERNADVVYMASYAPLFARLNYTQWSPDMIWFNDAESYGSPTYYVQKLYSNNMGDYTLKSTLSQLSTQPTVYQNTSYDEETGDIIVKIANSGSAEQSIPVTLDSSFTITGKASLEQIANDDINAVNSINDPYNVAPERTVINDVQSGYVLTLPSYSFTVMRIETKTGSIKDEDDPEPEPEPDKAEGKYQVMGYTTGTDANSGSLHLALSSDNGGSFTPVNYGNGVLYAPADYTENTYTGVTKYFESPYIFNMEDGGFGVIAIRRTEKSDTDNRDGSVMFYTSDDLMSFNSEGYIELDGSVISDPKCKYADGVYKLSWTNAAGIRYETTTTDFRSFTAKEKSTDLYAAPESGISGASAVNIIAVDETVYNQLINKLTDITNTGVTIPDKVTVDVNFTAKDLPRATASFSDGSTEQLDVNWDLSGIDPSKEGTYTINGTIEPKTYPSVMMADRADPCVMKYNGMYYFIATIDDGFQNDLVIRCADTLDGLASAEDHIVYDSGNNLIWAPELHEIDGTVYIFFATGAAWNQVESHVVKLTGDDLLSADSWSAPIRVKDKDGNNLAETGSRITLDMTCFEVNGKYYAAWSDRIVDTSLTKNASADILIAEYSPENAQMLSDTVRISKPDYGWERSHTFVDEGPFILKHNGRIFMTISANATDSTYSIGLLELVNQEDPLNPDSWVKQGYPLLSTANNAAEPGPGHNAYVKNEYGDDVLVFHWGNSGAHRTTSMRTVHWAADGTPVLYDFDKLGTSAENVSITVEIKAGGALSVADPVYSGTDISFTLKNAQGMALRAYAAEYDSSGALAGVVLMDVNAASASEALSIPYTLKDNSHSLMLYIWDSEQKPVIDATIIK